MSSGFVSNAIAVIKNNARMLGKRKTLSNRASGMTGLYGNFEDHKQMKGHEFAEFQKKLYEENAGNRKRFLLVFWISMFIVLVILIYFLFFYQMDPIKPLKWPE